MTVETWTLRETPKLSGEQFLRWQALLEERTGIQITEARQSFLETSLMMRMREIDVSDYDTYYRSLMRGLSGEMEWSTLVDRLSVQETRFFRHENSYALVRQHVASLMQASPDKRQIELWSVGCATGEEPYSLAMMMDDLVEQQFSGRYFGVTGTDLSTPALNKARKGLYGQRKVRLLSGAYVERYFEARDSERFEVSERLKRHVCFARLNMLHLDQAPLRNVDVIFCQNVLIYFKRWRKEKIVNQLAELLAPGGLLVLGVGELLEWSHPLMERVPFEDTLAYVRRDSTMPARDMNWKAGRQHG